MAKPIDEMADSLSVLFQNTEVRFSCDLHVPEGKAAFDGELLYRVLENLLSNALRFAQRRIVLAFYLEHETLSATVTDDGTDFSEKMLQKKTALFYSEDSSSKHLGLGLAVSRVLCQKHGGTIELSNVEPHGACVKASLTFISVALLTNPWTICWPLSLDFVHSDSFAHL